MRQWARSKGIEVGERGRLSPDVLAAYSAAHGGPAVKSAPAAAKKATKKATKKAPAKRAAAKKAPAKRAAAKNPPAASVSRPMPSESTKPTETAKPSFRQPEQISAPPASSADNSRVAALEEQIAKLSERLKRLESAGTEKRGLFSRKK